MQDKIFILPSREPVEPKHALKSNLPIQLTSFIGREQEVAAVCALLRRPEVRLMTLTGPGGVGKTRLGFQIVTDLLKNFADGVFFVSLAPIRDPELVIPTIVQILALREAEDQPPFEHLKSYLREKHLLLLLDNFEQVITVAPLLTELLQACRDLKMIVTSRAVLHVSGEHEFPVPPLTLPDLKQLPENEALKPYGAVALFLQRAEAIKPDFHMTNANARTIAEICVRLEGLPLAIELAAARMKLLPPRALLARLDKRLQVLTSGSQDMPVRQQTLRNTIAWSYDLLNSEEQSLFRRLSVFVGGCTLEAAAAVCNKANDLMINVLEGVASLIDKSLLQQTEQEGEEPRLVMLETIREYSLEVLAANQEGEAVKHAHAAYYLAALAEQAEAARGGPQQALWLERLEREHDNLRAALYWLIEQEKREMSLRLCSSLLRFWRIRGHASEGLQWLERALFESEGVEASVRAKAFLAAAELAFLEPDFEHARRLLEESLTLYRKLGDKQGVARVLMWLEEGSWKNTQSPAQIMSEDALVVFKEVGDRESIADALWILGGMAFKRGDYARARTMYEESLQIARDVGEKEIIATLLSMSLAKVTLYQGDSSLAQTYAQESLELFREIGDRGGVALSLNALAEISLSQGNVTTVYPLLEESLTISKEEVGGVKVLPKTLSLLARMALIQHDYDAARTLYEQSLAIDRKLDSRPNIASGLEGLAGVVVTQGHFRWAARLWGLAEAMRDAIGIPLPPVERVSREEAIVTVRSQLDEKTFVQAWAEGRTMTLEQVLTAGEASTSHQQLPSEERKSIIKKEAYPASLAAQGMTKPQIAERLIISLHTVNAHMRSIYNKLNVTSRTAMTRYALEHKLL